MTYPSLADFRQALEQRLLNQSRDAGTDLNWLRRRLVFERILARLTTSQPGAWVVKGGMAIELRIGNTARMTKDLDLNLRGQADEPEDAHRQLIAALSNDTSGDGFLFDVSPPKGLKPDDAGRPGWRFSVAANLAGRNFATVPVDVVARTDELSATEMLPISSMLSFAGFEDFEIESADVPQQFAEKIHAFTLPRGEGRDNTRVKDLADVVLFIEEGLDADAAAGATENVFSVRNTHPIPQELPEPPHFWGEDYPKRAEELGLAAITVQQAMRTLNDFWDKLRP